MADIADSVLDIIGRTPLLRLGRLCRAEGIESEILVKIEYYSPGGSHKDRVALYMIEAAEREGRLKPGGVVVEATSGNMGTGLAIACAVKGYQMVAVMSETMTIERRMMLRALGAEVVLMPVTADSHGQITVSDYHQGASTAAAIAEERGGIWADQFNNVENLRAHYEMTGREILEQTDGELDIYVNMVGSAGTAMGVARALKEHDPGIRVIVGEPANSAVISGNPPQAHRLQGVGAGFVPPFYDPELCDGLITVTDDEAAEMARKLARLEGVFCGFSSGANVAAAVKVARAEEPGQRIVTIIHDTGLKYLSTDLFRSPDHDLTE